MHGCHRPDGKKKAYVRLTADHDALDVANKVRLTSLGKRDGLDANSCAPRSVSSKSVAGLVESGVGRGYYCTVFCSTVSSMPCTMHRTHMIQSI